MASTSAQLDRFDDLRANGFKDNQARSMASYVDTTFDERFGELVARIDARFDESDARNQKRFDSIESRFEKIDNRFEKIEGRLDNLDKNLNERFAAVNDRFDALNVRIASRKYEVVVITAAFLIALIGLMPSIVETFMPFFAG